MTSRRTFLHQAAAVGAAGVLVKLPSRQVWARRPADLLQEPDQELLRELAARAMEAARAAGASFADVRVAMQQDVAIRTAYDAQRAPMPIMEAPSVASDTGFGVRALVDGSWGFSSGYELTVDAVVRVARIAVERARITRPRHRKALELAGAPVVPHGRWTTPIEQDPFSVTFGTQGDTQLAALGEAIKVPAIVRGSVYFGWRRIDQAFASTDGSNIVQRLYLAEPVSWLEAKPGEEYTRANDATRGLRVGGYGYEAVTEVDLTREARAAAERAADRARTLTPPKPVEVGRYDIVFAGYEVGSLLGETLARALDLERALGYQANGNGTSFAAPPGAVLGHLGVASPLITVRCDRTRPHGRATVAWDDEGVAPEDYTLIQDGIVTDYHTTRQTAAELMRAGRRDASPPRSHGCAYGMGQAMPRSGTPNLTLQPGRSTASVDDLIADTARGIYVSNHAWGQPDQQLISAQYATEFARVHEIRSGKLGARLDRMAFQFVTPQLWKNVDAIGGPASVVQMGVDTGVDRRSSMQLYRSSVTAVPMRARQVNVLSVGRIA